MDVGENTTLGNGDVTQELVQLLIVADGKLEVTGNDTGLLVVTGGVSSQLENLSSEVLENGSKVNGSTGTDTLGVVTLAEQTVDTANREGQTSLGGTAEGVDVSMKRRYRMRNVNNLRLRVLAAASLAAGLSASHFDGLFGGGGSWFWWKREESCLKVESLGYGVKSQEQVGERVEAEDLYKDAVRVTLGQHQWPSRSRSRLDVVANDQSDQTFRFRNGVVI